VRSGRAAWSAQAPSASTMAAAASFNPGALPAVMVPWDGTPAEPRQRFERRVGPVVLVFVEWRGSFLRGPPPPRSAT